MVTVAGTILLVPLVLAALNIPKEWGVSETVNVWIAMQGVCVQRYVHIHVCLYE
jgi:hypothetical protein